MGVDPPAACWKDLGPSDRFARNAVRSSAMRSAGMIADLKWVKEVMDRYVIDHVDHRNLNLDVEFLRDIVPTAENLACVFWSRLVRPISERARLVRVRVQETENNVATYEEP